MSALLRCFSMAAALFEREGRGFESLPARKSLSFTVALCEASFRTPDRDTAFGAAAAPFRAAEIEE
jgi:hypothetical protein